MLEIQKNEFEKYFKKFDTENENIIRKYNHSIRVMGYSIEIAKSLNLSRKMIETIGIAGLLHDIGRFKQWEKYNTSSDISSINHAELGVEILKNNNYIKKYVFDDEYINMVYKAVYEHNKYKISNNLSFDEEIVCKIIRDADKLDLLESQGNSIKTDEVFHQEFLENIYKKQCCAHKAQENEADSIIKQICFIYDINFQYSLKYIKNKNILSNKIDLLKNNCPKNINLDDVEIELTNYLNNRIN